MKYQLKEKNSTLNLAPMIDIVFLLLIFFLVSSTLQGEEVLYNITVPASSIGQSLTQGEINIFLKQNNEIYFDEKKYSSQNIDELFTVINTEKNKKVKIYSDRKSDFESVIFLIEEFKNQGYQNISFALREKN
ncbi:outer membrane transport energization protein ExbD [Halanaerobium saccharolyticum]|uniref:Outer membrane transport energization protein ExbD n=1 Tax=Halanaerobium saccharolyticum TaxID=43595 RepID=A0A4R7ZDJ3_9FIRM|nr:biopolymer transporter ExbD [Halanaerobium saccharolyticum]RAK11103.1 outer membrane transport energization protein ExbD [Halanaerobium saccharolyticum]TDW06954.1 outer membrane transport energization protein ExbD [Halanaerobium saccharolyticum]TDX63719.1 outer membrane transport energization protein ExbD [Halanaerobium saccharolyticum]